MVKATETDKGPGKCFNCGKEVTGEEFCWGCKNYVCDKCDVSLGMYPMGRHEKDVHLIEPEED